MLSRFVNAGWPDPRRQNHHELLLDGVPLARGQPTAKTNRGKSPRWHIRYANFMWGRWCADHPGASAAERNARRKMRVEEWKTLDAGAKRAFQVEYPEGAALAANRLPAQPQPGG